ncbi:MAG: TetR/AcrR family transcriptional regulator [Rhodanobacteraceae bacterium]
MDAGTELIWQKGYNAVTVDAICDRAGVKKGSFYYFFESKAALAIASMENYWQTQTRPRLDAAFSASLPPLERLRAFFEKMYQGQRDMIKTRGNILGCPYFSLGMEGGGLDAEVWHASQGYVKRKMRYIEATIRDAEAEGSIRIASVEEATQALQTLAEGALARARVQNDPEPLRGLYGQALRLLGAEQPTVEA